MSDKIQDGYGDACPHGISIPAACGYCTPPSGDLSWLKGLEEPVKIVDDD